MEDFILKGFQILGLFPLGALTARELLSSLMELFIYLFIKLSKKTTQKNTLAAPNREQAQRVSMQLGTQYEV